MEGYQKMGMEFDFTLGHYIKLPKKLHQRIAQQYFIFIPFWLGQENSLAKQMEGHQKMDMEFNFTLGPEYNRWSTP